MSRVLWIAATVTMIAAGVAMLANPYPFPEPNPIAIVPGAYYVEGAVIGGLLLIGMGALVLVWGGGERDE